MQEKTYNYSIEGYLAKYKEISEKRKSKLTLEAWSNAHDLRLAKEFSKQINNLLESEAKRNYGET